MADIFTNPYTVITNTPGMGDWKILIDITGLHTDESLIEVKATVGGSTINGSLETRTKADGESTAYFVVPVSCIAAKAVVVTVKSNNSEDTNVAVSATIQRASVNMLALNGKLTDGTPDAEDRPVLNLKQIAIENPDDEGEGIAIVADYGIGIVSMQDGIVCYSSGNGIRLYSEGYADSAALVIGTYGSLDPDIIIGDSGLKGRDVRDVITSWIPLGGTARAQLDKCATRDQLEAAIWAQTRFRMSIPEKVERPESGTITYTFGISTFDRDGVLADCDTIPVVHAYYQDGTSADAKLGAITKIDGMTGLYTFTFEVAATDPDYDHIRFVGSGYDSDGFPIGMTDYTNIVDDASPDFTADDRINLNAAATSAADAKTAAEAIDERTKPGGAGDLAEIATNVADVLASMPTVSEITDDIDANSELLGQIAGDVAGLDGAAIPSLSEICNASIFVGAFPAAVLANAPRTGMVLSATSLARGPEAALTDADIAISVFKNGSPRLTARVYLNGEGILQSDVASITYSIYELTSKPDERIAVAGHTDVPLNPVDVLFDTMQSDAQSSRYNFKFQIPVSEHPAFTIAGRNYLVEGKINPVDGEVLIIRWRCDCI